MDANEREEEQDRLMRIRRTARKLAKNQSRQRTIRKLPQTVIVLPAVKPRRASHLRTSINRNKRLTYILLLGASLCAYFYDIDQDTVEYMLRTVEQAASTLRNS